MALTEHALDRLLDAGPLRSRDMRAWTGAQWVTSDLEGQRAYRAALRLTEYQRRWIDQHWDVFCQQARYDEPSSELRSIWTGDETKWLSATRARLIAPVRLWEATWPAIDQEGRTHRLTLVVVQLTAEHGAVHFEGYDDGPIPLLYGFVETARPARSLALLASAKEARLFGIPELFAGVDSSHTEADLIRLALATERQLLPDILHLGDDELLNLWDAWFVPAQWGIEDYAS